MVGEFACIQGEVGDYYDTSDGEPPAVAIRERHQPQGAVDDLPTSSCRSHGLHGR